MGLALKAAAIVACFPSIVSAEQGPWTDREICRAAAKTYFFLDSKPDDSVDEGSWFGFRSAAGNVYSCRIEGVIAAFSWLNNSGEAMESRSSSFLIDGDQLQVQTDMSQEAFTME